MNDMYTGIDPRKLPRDPSNNCKSVYPRDFILVNNIFEVVKQNMKGSWTAWTDKNNGYDWMRGASGTAIDDLFTPEVSSFDKANITLSKAYDKIKADAIVNWIHGKKWDGSNFSPKKTCAPTIFGGNFVTLNNGAKYSVSDPTHGAPYLPGSSAEFSPQLKAVMMFLDNQLGRIRSALDSTNQLRTTAVFILSKHGQAPVNREVLKKVSTNPSHCPACSPGAVLQANSSTAMYFGNAAEDTGSYIWLTPQFGRGCTGANCDKTDECVAVLENNLKNGNGAGIFKIYSHQQISEVAIQSLMSGMDDRVPDVSHSLQLLTNDNLDVTVITYYSRRLLLSPSQECSTLIRRTRR